MAAGRTHAGLVWPGNWIKRRLLHRAAMTGEGVHRVEEMLRLADTLGIVFAFRWTGAALACGVMSFPLLVRPMRLSIEAVDQRLEQAAATLGAAPWRVFLTITLPLALPGVLAGMVLGFAKAIGEFGATITFVSNIPGETQVISSAIYSLIQTPDGDVAALRLVIISVAIAVAALIASEWFARRATRRLHGN